LSVSGSIVLRAREYKVLRKFTVNGDIVRKIAQSATTAAKTSHLILIRCSNKSEECPHSMLFEDEAYYNSAGLVAEQRFS